MSTERDSVNRVLISYTSSDVGEAESIARMLTAAGLRPWFDRWNLVPGSDRLASTNRAIAGAQTVLELIGARPDDHWRKVERVVSTKGAPRLVPVLLPQATGLPVGLTNREPVDLRGVRLDSIEAVTALVHAVTGMADPARPPHAIALEDLQRALGRARQILGEDHAETLIAAANLASILHLRGDYEAARRMFEDVIKRSRRVPGDETSFTITASANLAASLWSLGSYEQARQLLEETIAVAGRVLEPDGLDAGQLHGNLATVLHDLGEYDRALDECREALRITEAVLGPQHPATASRHVNLGDLLENVGRPAAAAEEYQRALHINEASLRQDDPAGEGDETVIAVTGQQVEEGRAVTPAGVPYSAERPTGQANRGLEVLSEDEADWLARVEIFSGVEQAAHQQILAVATPRSYRKGELLFVEHDPGESLIILRRGAVAIFRTAPTGERAVLTVVRPYDVIGEVSLLDSSARSASAEAIEDSRTLSLSRSAFIELVRANPLILDAVMRSVGGLIRRLTEQKTDHVFLDLPGRVAKTLVRLAGDSQAPLITIELNQSQLAEMADGSRQSVNQAIGSFANRGWLRTEGRRIVLSDLPALRRRAGMAGSNEGRRPPEEQVRRGSPIDGVRGYQGWPL